MSRKSKPSAWVRYAALAGFLAVYLSCGRPPPAGVPVVLTLRLASTRALPFSCYGVHVSGPGITGGGGPADGNPCARPGIGSAFIAPSHQTTSLSLRVPAGRQRVIQVVGVQGPGCPGGGNLADTLSLYEGGAPLPADITGLFEVGRLRTDLFGPAAVEIPLSHDGNNPLSLTFCENGEPIPPLRLSPPSVSLGTGDGRAYTGTGGFPPYEIKNAVGGVLIASTFTAEPTEGSTALTVRDSRGNETTVTGRSFGGTGTDVWLRAASLTAGDGDPVATWSNEGDAALLDQLVKVGGGNITYRASLGPGGTPAVHIDGAAHFTRSTPGYTPSTTVTHAHVFWVGKRVTPNEGAFLCLTSDGSCSNPSADFLYLKSSGPGRASFAYQRNGAAAGSAGFVEEGGEYRLHRGTFRPGRISLLLNGVFLYSDHSPSQTLNLLGGSSTHQFLLGYDGSTALEGLVTEVIVYFSDRTEDQLTQTADYLALKYGL